MKKHLYIKFIVLIILVQGMLSVSLTVMAQQYKPRVSVDYFKVMGADPFLLVNVKFKGDDGYEPATGLSLNVYQQLADDSLGFVSEITTDHNGNAKYVLEQNMLESGDSIIVHEFVIKVENNEKFSNAKKGVKFTLSELQAEAIEIDSVQNISAKLLDAAGNPLEGEKLTVTVHRLFAPLTIGKSSYKTDDDGTILVPMEEPLPGVDGILTFEVMLDSRKYGTVSYIFEAPIGTPVVDLSTFDQRTMWSPPTKTPLFLWIFPNIIIFGIWATIALLITNLYKIYKS